MNRAQTDPLVSCPIVCGEYMRATGFFFSTEEKTYLLTARHNALPTNSDNFPTGNMNLGYQTEDHLPIIDIYLKETSGFTVERLDIREVDGVVQSPKIDILAVPVDFAPGEHGYQVWKEADVSSPNETTESLELIGYDGVALPDGSEKYAQETYLRGIGNPAMLSLKNELVGASDISKYGVMAPGIDESFVGPDEEYNGLSGAPILGDGLVGIHALNENLSPRIQEQFDGDKFTLLAYTRADILPKVLN